MPDLRGCEGLEADLIRIKQVISDGNADSGDLIYSSRDCPILQDLDGKISRILARCKSLSDEEIIYKLINDLSAKVIRETRSKVFTAAVGLYAEQLDIPESFDIRKLKLATRKGPKATHMRADELIQLFNYICGLDSEFPLSVLKDPTVIMDVQARDPQYADSSADCLVPHDAEPAAEPGTEPGAEPTRPGAAMDPHAPPFLPACTESAPSTEYDHQAFLDMVGRCRDYERAILDMREIIDTMRFELNDLKSSTNESPPSSTTVNSGHSSPHQPGAASHPNPTTTRHPSHNDLEGLGSPPPTHPDTPAPPAASSPPGSSSRDLNDIIAEALAEDTPQTSESESADASNSTPEKNSITQASSDNSLFLDLEYRLNLEVEHMQNQITDIDERMSSTETRMSQVTENIDNLSREDTDIKLSVNKLSEKLSSQGKRAKKLSRKRVDQPTVRTDNRFEPLANLTEDTNKPQPTGGKPHNSERKRRPKDKKHKDKSDSVKIPLRRKSKKPKSKAKKEIKVKIFGSSLVRDMGQYVDDEDDNIRACSCSYPGYKAEELTQTLKHCVRDTDDVLVIQGGTNNIPVESVSKCIRHIDDLLMEALRCKQSGHIIISELPLRLDGNYMAKVREVNEYINHVCNKYENMHVLSHVLTREDLSDGLHLSVDGKTKVANCIREMVNKLR